MQKTIKSVKYFSTGYCKNNLGLVFKGQKKEIRDFPAGVFLIQHEKHGYILFDTGYSTEIYHAGIIGKLYNLFNPTFVDKKDPISEQLKKAKIKPDDIKTIILSHLHPDHIGDLKSFKNAKIIISSDEYDSYKKHKLRSLIIERFFPEDFEQRIEVIKSSKLKKPYDYYKDKSIKLIELEGHAKGQICAIVADKILLAADTCWGRDLLEKSYHIKFPASLIQDNIKDYRKTLDKLQELEKDGLTLYFSHDQYSKKELL